MRLGPGMTRRSMHPSGFGDRIDYKIDPAVGSIVLARDAGLGYQPYRLLLPHQIYYADTEALFAAEPTLRAIVLTEITLPWRIVAERGSR